MRFLKFATLAMLFALPLSWANAGSLGSLLTFDGVEDVLVDQSVDSFLDNGDGVFGLGDVLFGIAQIDQVNPGGPAPNIDVSPQQVAVGFAAEVTEFDSVAQIPALNQEIFTVEFGAVTDPANSLNQLLGNGFEGTLTDDTIFAVFERNGGTPAPIDFINTPGTADALEFFNTDAPNPFSFVFSGGIDPLTDDFFEAQLTFNTVTNALLSGDQRGGFTIFENNFGIGTQFLPVSVLGLDGITVTEHDITIAVGSNITPADADTLANGFLFQNNVQFGINAVPEPSTVLSFCGVLALGLRRLKRRKA